MKCVSDVFVESGVQPAPGIQFTPGLQFGEHVESPMYERQSSATVYSEIRSLAIAKKFQGFASFTGYPGYGTDPIEMFKMARRRWLQFQTHYHFSNARCWEPLFDEFGNYIGPNQLSGQQNTGDSITYDETSSYDKFSGVPSFAMDPGYVFKRGSGEVYAVKDALGNILYYDHLNAPIVGWTPYPRVPQNPAFPDDNWILTWPLFPDYGPPLNSTPLIVTPTSQTFRINDGPYADTADFPPDHTYTDAAHGDISWNLTGENDLTGTIEYVVQRAMARGFGDVDWNRYMNSSFNEGGGALRQNNDYNLRLMNQFSGLDGSLFDVGESAPGEVPPYESSWTLLNFPMVGAWFGQFRTCGPYLIIGALVAVRNTTVVRVKQFLIAEGDGKFNVPVTIPMPTDGSLPDPYYDGDVFVAYCGRVNFAVFGMSWKEYVNRYKPDLANP